MDIQEYFCESCKHFNHKWRGWGWCKRFPIPWIKKREDWCGEYEPPTDRVK